MKRPVADPATPMMRQYQALKRACPGCILFFRMGDFYEMFGPDALEAAPILGIALTSRERDKDGGLPMCGVPHHAVEQYIARLIRAGRKVAIGDQVEDPRFARGIVKRELTRIVTPGTVLDEKLLEASENSYLAAVHGTAERIGLAFLDLTTAEFRAAELAGPGALENLAVELDRIGAREVLLPETLATDPAAAGRLGLPAALVRTGVADWSFDPGQAAEALRDHFEVATLEGYGLAGLELAIGAAGALLAYVRDTQKADPTHITAIAVMRSEDHLVLDAATIRNLELTRTIQTGDRRGTLLDLLDMTATAMGARLLQRWLLRPLTSPAAIEGRLDVLAALVARPEERRELRRALRNVQDLERLVSRICLATAGPRDLAALRASLAVLPGLLDRLAGLGCGLLADLAAGCDPLADLAELLATALADSPPAAARDGNVIRPGHSAELDELRSLSGDARSLIAAIETGERRATGIASLKVRYNSVFGYYIEVTRANLGQVPERYLRKQTLAQAERFYTPELKELESRVLGAEEKIAALEAQLFQELRARIAAQAARLQAVAGLLAAADVLAGLAEAADQYGYVRPEIAADDRLEIEAGRHPVIERLAERRRFEPNDARLDTADHQIVLLTGPNMAGKSTFIRQVALIALMAQVGSFVPAARAHVGIVDRIFTRVGASDNLYGGLSTFMVEMTETANILNCATPRSLIILDEVGRGTATYDGLSIAWAVVEHLHETPAVAARTLFATHYHELTELAGRLSRVKNYTVQVREWNDQVIFLRKVAPGCADRSYGIQVARLAGLPAAVIERAKEVLAGLEGDESTRAARPRPDREPRRSESGPAQLALFAPAPLPARVVELLAETDVDRLTPLEGLARLARLKAELEKTQ